MKREAVVFCGGCFWCTEAVFKMIKGVKKAVPGYAGGVTKNPTYMEVSTGRTGHAEAVYIEYEPEQAGFRDLLTVFFATHDPTTPDRQGNDIGTQYRSAIFYTTAGQREEALRFIESINASSKEGRPAVTEVAPFTVFYEAEDYHKDYFEKHRDNPYCRIIINPKLEKVRKEFAKLLET